MNETEQGTQKYKSLSELYYSITKTVFTDVSTLVTVISHWLEQRITQALMIDKPRPKLSYKKYFIIAEEEVAECTHIAKEFYRSILTTKPCLSITCTNQILLHLFENYSFSLPLNLMNQECIDMLKFIIHNKERIFSKISYQFCRPTCMSGCDNSSLRVSPDVKGMIILEFHRKFLMTFVCLNNNGILRRIVYSRCQNYSNACRRTVLSNSFDLFLKHYLNCLSDVLFEWLCESEAQSKEGKIVADFIRVTIYDTLREINLLKQTVLVSDIT